MANGEKALPAEADAKPMNRMFTDNGGQLGKVDKAVFRGVPGLFRTHNAELAKFLLLPENLTPYVVLGIFSVDTSRSINRVSYLNGVENKNLLPMPTWIDVANDDKLSDNDEDNDLVFNSGRSSTNYVFAYDAPGLGPWQAKTDGVYLLDGVKVIDYTYRGNFFDFVRIQIGAPFVPGPPPAGTLVKGSRASVYYFWHSLMRVVQHQDPITKAWSLERYDQIPLQPDMENRIGMGHVSDIFQIAGGGGP
jgi:hypothetical protein